MQDTFFLEKGMLLRTQTSGVQMRALMQKKLPLRIISSGAVYRKESDASHTPMFHQLECLMVDTQVNLSHLKGCLTYLMDQLFQGKVHLRFRSNFFPFVEPGMEVDISCFLCTPHPQKNCRICKETLWIEILGAGMVHPHLFETAKINQPVSGFAFGLGVEWIAMLLYAIPDLHYLFSSGPRFLNQFPGD